MKFKVLFFDIDGTVIDIKKSVNNSLNYCFSKLNIKNLYDNEKFETFYKINSYYWKNLGIKYKTINEILELRFIDFFNKYNINKEAKLASKYYEEEAGRTVFPIGDIKNIIIDLKKYCKIYATTNGKTIVQKNKITNAGLIDVFDGIFISEDIGYNKPQKEFFEKIFDIIGKNNKNEILMIGDTLDADMQGANNAQIKCCLYNEHKTKYETNLKIDYEIQNHKQLYDILEINKKYNE